MTEEELKIKLVGYAWAYYEGEGADAIQDTILAAFAELRQERDMLREVASALVCKMDRIQHSSEYFAVWSLSAKHGFPYEGDTWEVELMKLRELLEVT